MATVRRQFGKLRVGRTAGEALVLPASGAARRRASDGLDADRFALMLPTLMEAFEAASAAARLVGNATEALGVALDRLERAMKAARR